MKPSWNSQFSGSFIEIYIIRGPRKLPPKFQDFNRIPLFMCVYINTAFILENK
jgi:hypothetical protein